MALYRREQQLHFTMSQPQTNHDPNEMVVFGDGNSDFRIPALIYVKEWKTLLAFAERRTVKNDRSYDENAKHLVMRKRTRQDDGSLQWSDCKDLMEATKHGYRTMSPCPVYERNTNTLFLFFICIEGGINEGILKPGQTRLCYVTTTDVGENWSGLTDLTDSVKVNGINLSEYKTFAVGPGHGIAVERGENDTRLLIPAYVKSTRQPDHSLVFYSDDDGQTWQAGECGECQVAEVRVTEGIEGIEGIEGTKLYCSARTYRKGVPRLEALSDVTLESFTKLESLTLKETPHGCQGSVLGFPAPELYHGDQGSCNTMLLYSHPTKGPKQGENGWTRRDLGIYLRESLQDGGDGELRPWGEPYIIHHGKGGYSDLAPCEKKARFACLMECGVSARQRIVFKEFPLSDIPKPAPVDRHDPAPNPSDPAPNPSDPVPNPSDPAPNPSDPAPNPSDPAPNPSDLAHTSNKKIHWLYLLLIILLLIVLVVIVLLSVILHNQLNLCSLAANRSLESD